MTFRLRLRLQFRLRLQLRLQPLLQHQLLPPLQQGREADQGKILLILWLMFLPKSDESFIKKYNKYFFYSICISLQSSFIDDGEIKKETGVKAMNQNQSGRWRTYLKQNVENNSILFNNHFIFIIFYI